MLIDAAVDGQGVALARTTLAAWDLINRRLVRPFPVALPLSKSYWIVSPKATASLPKLVAFREWLLAQANDDTRRLEVVVGPPFGSVVRPDAKLQARRAQGIRPVGESG
jgi:LysR family glycine cleavage system transcriptional activator